LQALVHYIRGSLLFFSIVIFIRFGVLGAQSWRIYIVWEILETQSFRIEIPFIIDIYSLLFMGTVIIIASRVILFSRSYMSREKHFLRFHLILIRFVFSIFILILRPRIISLFLGWDGLGVTSFFLVIFFSNSKSFNAGIITAIRNRIGDVLFLIRVFLLCNFSSWNFFIWRSVFEPLNPLIVFIVFFATCTKSAQIPFSAWLPAAIAAPTPVSALVHSSTLVTAGVYVLFRFHPLINSEKNSLLFLMAGSLTILIAGIRALAEIDAKKIVALSTLRQLGVIFITLGIKKWTVRFFHLISHAYFKALLFIVVGNIIHIASSYQDLRKFSITPFFNYTSSLIFTITNLSLCGLPFFSGFYSKDLCIESGIHEKNIRFLAEIINYMGVLLTLAYTMRFLFKTLNHFYLRPSNFFKEKEDFISVWILSLCPFSIVWRRIVRWIIFRHDIVIFYMPIEIKNLILFLLIIIAIFISINPIKFNYNSNVRKSLFFIWNLPFCTPFFPILFSFQFAKKIIICRENGVLLRSSFYFSKSIQHSLINGVHPFRIFTQSNFLVIFIIIIFFFL